MVFPASTCGLAKAGRVGRDFLLFLLLKSAKKNLWVERVN